MQYFKIITLVDITRSEINNCQLANFNTLIQSIGLRANPLWSIDPKKHTGALPISGRGKCAHWVWEFETEQDDLFLEDRDPTKLLEKDLNGVPVIGNLENTVDLDPCAFITLDNRPNTWVYIKA